MVLPLREKLIESTRQIRVTEVRLSKNSDGTDSADVEFELRHENEEGSVEECWTIFEIPQSEIHNITGMNPEWTGCKVHLVPMLNPFRGVLICITEIQFSSTWTEPNKITQSVGNFTH